MKKRRVKITKQLIALCLMLTMLLGITPPTSVGADTTDLTNPSSITADLMVKYMGRGTNLGNTFEMDLQPRDFDSVKKVMDAYIEAGFTNVRIPINYGGRESQTTNRADALGNVDFTNADLQTVKKLLDYVLYDVNPKRVLEGKAPIILIINTHHEDWAMYDLIGTAKYETNMKRLETIWGDVCEFYKDYPDTLVFELFNEPHIRMESGEKARLSVVDMTKRFYNVIRNYTVDGVKPHEFRKILFGGYNWNSSWGLWDTFRTEADLPGGGTDKYIIGTFHFYNPINIADKDLTNVVNNFQEKYSIPVHLGEYGVDHRGNVTSKVLSYCRYLSDAAISRNFATSVWDDSGWFTVYNRETGIWNDIKDQVLGIGPVPVITPDKPLEPVVPDVLPKAVSLPGQIEVEAFSANMGFQMETCTEGGKNFGYTDAGDWLDYTVDVQKAGTYTVEFRMAGIDPAGTLQLKKAGVVLATVTPQNTGGWQTWKTVKTTVKLSAGKQTLRLYSTGSAMNVNWLKFTLNKTVNLVPGQIETEKYSKMKGFKTQTCKEGGLNITNTNSGDWLEYDVNVKNAGTYTLEIRMAGEKPTGTLQLQKAGKVLATVKPPKTGAVQTWKTVKVKVKLSAGEQTLRLYSKGSKFNINWIKFTKSN